VSRHLRPVPVKRFPLQRGDVGTTPIDIRLVVDGENSYLKIGASGGPTLAVLGGKQRLKKIATAILAAVEGGGKA
jgi:hypothetical protein